MAQRARLSPVLGYNHNLRHGGRIFHVQTEDSGQGYARLHTHLFFEGTILSSKKQEYDPSAPEDAVRALMQGLHKSMIRELTRGEHDPRISAFFAARGEPAVLGAPAVAPEAAPAQAPEAPAAIPVVPAAPPAAATPPPVLRAAAQATPPPVLRAAAQATPPPVLRAAPPQATPKPVVIVKPGPVKRPPVVLSGAADGVVVRRNVVINVGGGAPPVNGTPATAERAAPAAVRGRGAAPPVAANDGPIAAGKKAAAARPPVPESMPQPLASSRDIRMPWETPGPSRVSSAPPIVAAAADPPRVTSGTEVKMPWDPPSPSPSLDAFAAGLADDKSLDEVILEYLSDENETEER
jgi:hypothetical protein